MIVAVPAADALPVTFIVELAIVGSKFLAAGLHGVEGAGVAEVRLQSSGGFHLRGLVQETASVLCWCCLELARRSNGM